MKNRFITLLMLLSVWGVFTYSPCLFSEEPIDSLQKALLDFAENEIADLSREEFYQDPSAQGYLKGYFNWIWRSENWRAAYAKAQKRADEIYEEFETFLQSASSSNIALLYDALRSEAERVSVTADDTAGKLLMDLKKRCFKWVEKYHIERKKKDIENLKDIDTELLIKVRDIYSLLNAVIGQRITYEIEFQKLKKAQFNAISWGAAQIDGQDQFFKSLQETYNKDLKRLREEREALSVLPNAPELIVQAIQDIDRALESLWPITTGVFEGIRKSHWNQILTYKNLILARAMEIQVELGISSVPENIARMNIEILRSSAEKLSRESHEQMQAAGIAFNQSALFRATDIDVPFLGPRALDATLILEDVGGGVPLFAIDIGGDIMTGHPLRAGQKVVAAPLSVVAAMKGITDEAAQAHLKQAVLFRLAQLSDSIGGWAGVSNTDVAIETENEIEFLKALDAYYVADEHYNPFRTALGVVLTVATVRVILRPVAFVRNGTARFYLERIKMQHAKDGMLKGSRRTYTPEEIRKMPPQKLLEELGLEHKTGRLSAIDYHAMAETIRAILLDSLKDQGGPSIFMGGDGAALFDRETPYRPKPGRRIEDSTESTVPKLTPVRVRQTEGALVKVGAQEQGAILFPEAEPMPLEITRPILTSHSPNRLRIAPPQEVTPEKPYTLSPDAAPSEMPHANAPAPILPEARPAIYLPVAAMMPTPDPDEEVWIIRREGGNVIGIRRGKQSSVIVGVEAVPGDPGIEIGTEEEEDDRKRKKSWWEALLEVVYHHSLARQKAKEFLDLLDSRKEELIIEQLKSAGDAIFVPMAVDIAAQEIVQNISSETGSLERKQKLAEAIADTCYEKLQKQGYDLFLSQERLSKLKEDILSSLGSSQYLIEDLIDRGFDDEELLFALEPLDIKASIQQIPFDHFPVFKYGEPPSAKIERDPSPSAQDDISKLLTDGSLSAPAPSEFDFREHVEWGVLSHTHQRFLKAIYESVVGKRGFIPFEIEGRIRRLRPVTVDGLSGFEIRSAYRVYEILFDPNLVSPPFLFPAPDAESRRLVIRDPGKLGDKGIEKVRRALQRLIRADIYLNRYLRATDFEKEFVLNPYQEEGLRRLQAHRASGGKAALIVLPTGLGKTALFVEDAVQFVKEHPEAKILVVVDTQALASQLASEFEEGWARAKMRDPLLPLKTVGILFSGETSGLSSDIVVALRQSLVITNGGDQVTGIRHFSRDHFNYLIFDEAHHITNDSLQAISSYFNVNFTLGVTATPEDKNGDIRRHFGNEREGLYEVYAQEAMDAGFLCDVEIKRPEIENPSPEEVATEYLKVRSQFGSETVRTVIFTSSIAQAQAVEKAFLDREIRAQRLTSESHPAHWQKQGVIERFELGDFEVLIVVDVLNEGIDIPAIDLVFFLRKTESLRVYLQQLGRGLRVAPGKDVLYVVDWVNNKLFARLRGGENSAIRLSLNIRRDLQREQLRRGRRAFTIEAEKRYRDFCKWYLENLVERWSTVISMPYHLGQARAEWERRTGRRFEVFGKHIPPVMLGKIKEAFPPVYFIDRFDHPDKSPWMQQLVVLMEFWKQYPELSLTEIIQKYNDEIRYTRAHNGRRTLQRKDLEAADVERWMAEVPALISTYEPEIRGLEEYLSPQHSVIPNEPVIPSESSVIPSEDSVIPSEGSVIPSEGSVIPSENPVIPRSEATRDPSEPEFRIPTEEEIRQALGLDAVPTERLTGYAKAVAEAMAIFGISQQEFGRRVNLDQVTISDILRVKYGTTITKRQLPKLIAKIIEIGADADASVTLHPSDFESVSAIREAIARHEGELGGIARCKLALDFGDQEKINAYGKAIGQAIEALLFTRAEFKKKVGLITGVLERAEGGATNQNATSFNQAKIIHVLIGIARERDVALTYDDFRSEDRIRKRFEASSGSLGVVARIRAKYGFYDESADFLEIGQQIKESRITLGLTQKDLANMFNERLSTVEIQHAEGAQPRKKHQPALIAKLIIVSHQRGIPISFNVDMTGFDRSRSDDPIVPEPSGSPRSDEGASDLKAEQDQIREISEALGGWGDRDSLSAIGGAIRLLRKTLDISYTDLEKRLGLSTSSIYNIESGRVQTSLLNRVRVIITLMTLARERGLLLDANDFKDRRSMEEKLLSDRGEIGLLISVQKTLFDGGEGVDYQAIGAALKSAREVFGFSSPEKLENYLKMKGEEWLSGYIIRPAEQGKIGSATHQPKLIVKLILLGRERGIDLKIEDFKDPARIAQKFQSLPQRE